MGRPTNTTGYMNKAIFRTQYSTEGQHLIASSGSEIDVEAGAQLEVAGELEMLSGSLLDQQGGSTWTLAGVVRWTSAGDMRLGVQDATALNSTLNNSGFVIVRSTAKTVHRVSAPFKGSFLNLIIDTTAITKLRMSSTIKSQDVKCGSSIAVIALTSDAGKITIDNGRGLGLTLIGRSTSRWDIINVNTSAADMITYSSST